jgi:predicted nucleic acid-binding protein
MDLKPRCASGSISTWQAPQPRRRDAKDDPFLAAALAGGARYLVTNDRDLLDLGTPFGVAILTPVQFLRILRDQSALD